MTPINKIIIAGRLVADPELRNTPSGKAVANFIVAVRRNYKNKNGEYDSDFIGCQVWGKTAETVAKYFAKCSEIAAEGSYINNNYTDKDGVKRYSSVINVSAIVFGEKNKNTPAARGEEPAYALPAEGISDMDGFEEIAGDEDFPFE